MAPSRASRWSARERTTTTRATADLGLDPYRPPRQRRLGLAEGDADGDDDGDLDGEVLGLVEGDELGDVEGDVLGLADGLADGLVEGEAVGDVLGDADGDALGELVGEAVGETLGDEVAMSHVGSTSLVHVTPELLITLHVRSVSALITYPGRQLYVATRGFVGL